MVRSLRAFLNLQVGLTRDGGAVPWISRADRDRELEEARRELAELRARLVGDGADPRVGSVNPENVVWLFGMGRSGNTWLSSMMEDLRGHAVWHEPNVGFLFGYLYYDWAHERQRETKHFILGRYKKSWLNSIRNFVLAEARARFPALQEGDYLVVKDPNGSIGAPLMMEALPESRMVLLVRNPKDVVASILDGRQIGHWAHVCTDGAEPLAYEDPDAFVANRADMYLRYVGNSKLAYDAHKGPKALVRYEELRAETLATMKRMYSALEIPVDDRELARVAEKYSWENIAEEKKGEGKFYRKAEPGGWREDLTPEQAKTVERITAPLLEEFYPHEEQSEKYPEKSPLR
jgi:Sulfotransferase domain